MRLYEVYRQPGPVRPPRWSRAGFFILMMSGVALLVVNTLPVGRGWGTFFLSLGTGVVALALSGLCGLISLVRDEKPRWLALFEIALVLAAMGYLLF